MSRRYFEIPVTHPSMADEAIRSYFVARQGYTFEHPLVSVSRAIIESRMESAALRQQLGALSQRLTRIERGGLPIIAVVNDFFPHDLEVQKPIHICIEPDNEEFIATFHDADVSASGETHAEALCNLKDIIAMLFEDLTAEDPAVLGPGPLRQFEVLKRYIGKLN
jgi:predicted RNase H-like HicB family nuclease